MHPFPTPDISALRTHAAGNREHQQGLNATNMTDGANHVSVASSLTDAMLSIL